MFMIYTDGAISVGFRSIEATDLSFSNLPPYHLLTFSITAVTGLTVSLKLPVMVLLVSCPRSVPSTILVAFVPFPRINNPRLLI